jgi:23S rRNA (cytosine1962-C5)-methyltransferase
MHWSLGRSALGVPLTLALSRKGRGDFVSNSAKAGAEVCHVDASKAAVRWASDNAKLNGLNRHCEETKSTKQSMDCHGANAPRHDGKIRWIVDDALEFLRREQARGQIYDGVLLDPPPFGRAAGGEFLMKRDLDKLMGAVKAVLPERPKIFLLNSYAMNLKPAQLAEMIKPYFKGLKLQTGELRIGDLPLSSYVRISG